MIKKNSANYVALDIETSSLDAEEGEIIEIGAVKFNKQGKETDNFKTLVRNKKEIPKLALVITGIKIRELEKAPLFPEIKEKIKNFINNSIIIGHNVNFDIKFLKKYGLAIKNPVIDTWHLSSILLPGFHSHSLEMLTEKINIEHLEKHRALDDARASFRLFLFLKEKIKEIPLKMQAEIKKYLEKNKSGLAPLFTAKDFKEKEIKEKISKIDYKIDFKELKKIFEQKEPKIPFKSLDSEEIKIIKEISIALKENENLLLEIPVGVKKNLIYLLIASYFSKILKKKIFLALLPSYFSYISAKIVPFLKTIFPFDFSVSFFDTRENYFCLYRFDEFKEKKKFEKKELILLIKVILWIEESIDKKISEIPAFFEEREYLKKLSATLPFCLQEKCTYFKNKTCPYYKALWKSQKADIIVAPPQYLFAKNQNGLILKDSPLIIDKAEILDEITLLNATYYISDSEIIEALEDIKNFVKSFKKSKGFSETIEKIKNQTVILFGLVGIFLKNAAFGQFLNLIELQIQERHRNSLDFKKIKDALPGFIASLENIKNSFLLLKKGNTEFINHDISAYNLILQNIILKLKNIILEPKENENCTGYFRGKEISLSAAPKKNDYINRISKKTAPLILVSETLSLKKSFAFTKEKLSLAEKFKEISIPLSPKKLEKINILIVKNFQVNTAWFTDEISKLILKIAPLLNKKIIVALPSISSVQNVFEKTAEKIKEYNIDLMAMRISGGKMKIKEKFKKSKKAILLATYNFLERTEISKKNLNGIIITRLPFEMLRQEEQEKDSFIRKILPKALLKMKKMFNLILKAQNSKNFFLVLDDRISSKNYGPEFITILPPSKITWLKKEELEKKLEEYL